MRVGLDDAERPVEIRRVLVPVLIFAPETSLAFLPVALPLLPVGLPAPAAQAGEPGRRQRPVRLRVGDAAAGAQHGVGPGQFVGGGADIHVRVVEHEVVEVDELAFQPQAGRSFGIMCAGDKTGADRAFGEAFVKAGERILGGGKRAREGGPGQRIGDLVAGRQGLDNPNGNRSNGS